MRPLVPCHGPCGVARTGGALPPPPESCGHPRGYLVSWILSYLLSTYPSLQVSWGLGPPGTHHSLIKLSIFPTNTALYTTLTFKPPKDNCVRARRTRERRRSIWTYWLPNTKISWWRLPCDAWSSVVPEAPTTRFVWEDRTWGQSTWETLQRAVE